MKIVKKLEKKFEAGSYEYTQMESSENGYMYMKYGATISYEVFELKTTPICLNLDEKIFSETEFKEIYPKSNMVWKWTFIDYEKAKAKFNELNIKL